MSVAGSGAAVAQEPMQEEQTTTQEEQVTQEEQTTQGEQTSTDFTFRVDPVVLPSDLRYDVIETTPRPRVRVERDGRDLAHEAVRVQPRDRA